MATITVTHLADDKYRTETRDHVILVDQPSDEGIEIGPTPVELLVMALAACAAHYGVSHLRGEGLPSDGLAVRCRWSMRANPASVGRIELTMLLPAPLEPAQQERLLAAIDHCTVHNTLRHPPRVAVEISELSMVPVGAGC